MVAWEELETFLLEQAALDLAASGDVQPCLAAFAGSAPLLIAFLRPFAKGAYENPMIEVLALALPLGADRLVFCSGARAWSLDDPLPPVVPGVGDLRQRVVVLTGVDGGGDDVERFCSVHPFTLRPSGVEWASPVVREQGAGWIGAALEAAVRSRGELGTSTAAIRRQARRCTMLGHVLAIHPAVADRLRLHGGAGLRRL